MCIDVSFFRIAGPRPPLAIEDGNVEDEPNDEPDDSPTSSSSSSESSSSSSSDKKKKKKSKKAGKKSKKNKKHKKDKKSKKEKKLSPAEEKAKAMMDKAREKDAIKLAAQKVKTAEACQWMPFAQLRCDTAR